MDATNPLARGTTLPADEAAAPFASDLPGATLPWQTAGGDRRRAPSNGTTTEAADAAGTADATAETAQADLVAAFKQALAGPAPSSPRPATSGPTLEGNASVAGLAAAPNTLTAPPPRPEFLYSQVAAAFVAPATEPTPTPGFTGSVPTAPDIVSSAKVSPLETAISSLPAAAQTRASAPSAKADRPALTGQTTNNQGAREAATQVASVVSSRPNNDRTGVNPTSSVAAPTSLAGRTAVDHADRPATAATGKTVTAEAAAAFAAPRNVTPSAPSIATAADPLSSAVSSRPAESRSNVDTASSGAALPSFARQTAVDRSNGPAATATLTATTSEAPAASTASGNVTPATPEGAPTAPPLTSAVSFRPAESRSNADTTSSGPVLPSFAGQIAADQSNGPAAATTVTASTSKAPAASTANGKVTPAAPAGAPTTPPLTSAVSFRPAESRSNADTASSGPVLPSFAGQIAADRSNGPAVATTVTASTSEAPAASTANGKVTPAAPAGAALPSFDGQASSDQVSQRTVTAAGKPTSPEAVVALAASANVTPAAPGLASGNVTAFNSAVAARPSNARSNVDPSSERARTSFADRRASDRGQPRTAAATGTAPPLEAPAAFAASGNVTPAAPPVAPTAPPVDSAAAPRVAGKASDAALTPAVSTRPATSLPNAESPLSRAALPSFTGQASSDQGNQPTATTNRSAVSSEVTAAFAASGKAIPATPAVGPSAAPLTPAVAPRPATSLPNLEIPSSGAVLPSLADQSASNQGKPRTATVTEAPRPPEPPAAFAASGHVAAAAPPAAPTAIPAISAVASRLAGTPSNVVTASSDAALPSLNGRIDFDPGKPTATPDAAPAGPLVSTFPLRTPPAATRPPGTDATAAAAQSSAGALAGAATPVRAAAADPAAPTEESPGDAVLRSLAFQATGLAVAPSAPAITVDAPASVRPADRVAALQETIAATVSRMLVSDPLHDGGREVRIEFATDVLPETSVRLWRHEGRLNVEFTSTAAMAEAGLRDGLPRLAEAIQRQSPLAGLPEISLRLGDSAGQPGDGRSRQRYQTEEENGAQA